MKPSRVSRIILPTIALAAVVFAFQQGSARSVPLSDRWHTNLATASGISKKEKKLLMVDFSATWCGPCLMYKNQVFPTAEFNEATKNFVLAAIDVDENKGQAERNNVGPIPDIRIYTPDGRMIGSVVGYNKAELFAAIIKAKDDFGG